MTLSSVSGGITNQLFRVQGGEVTVLLRLFGNKTELLIDRCRELKAFLELNAAHLSAPLYGCFKNGYAYGYFPGRPLTSEDLCTLSFVSGIMRTLTAFHSLVPKTLPCPNRSQVFPYVEHLHEEAAKEIPRHAEIQERLPHFSLDKLLSQALRAERDLQLLHPGPVQDSLVFCHNDMLPGNLILWDQDDTINFIDYEYCDWNFPCHDMGNHWCEFTGLDVIVLQFPDHEARQLMVREYLTHRNPPKDNSDAEGPTQEMLDTFEKASLLSSLVANVQWCIWCVLQYSNSTLEFDYLTYLERRLKLQDYILEVIGYT